MIREKIKHSEPPDSRKAANGGDGRSEPQPLAVKPFTWVPWHALKRREFIYPRTYVRKKLTATIAASGIGKSGLIVTEALAMVTGRDLLGDGFKGSPLTCWLWNGEDDAEELQRQVQAAMHHFEIAPKDIGGRLILDSGRELPIRLAVFKNNRLILDGTLIERIKATIKRHRIDVSVFDPFVTMHNTPENLNENMDALAECLADIADVTNSATGIAMHTRKPASGFSGPVSSDDARGGGAVVARTRVARVLNRMTAKEAEDAGIQGKNSHRSYFRIGFDKQSLSPPDEDDNWRYLRGVRIPNGPTEFEGDSVRVVTRWEYPNALANVTAAHLDTIRDSINVPEDSEPWRADVQAKHWAGHLIGEIVGFDTYDATGKSRAGKILKAYLASGALRKTTLKSPKDRKEYSCIVRGHL